MTLKIEPTPLTPKITFSLLQQKIKVPKKIIKKDLIQRRVMRMKMSRAAIKELTAAIIMANEMNKSCYSN